MYRNDAVVPTFALIFALALFYMAFLDGQHVAALEGRMPEVLTVGQIGLMAFGMVLSLYGFIGLLSNWLEGAELRPGKHYPTPSSLPMVAGAVLALLLVAVSGFFARTLAFSFVNSYNVPALQGGLFAAMMLLMALMIAIYKKFFMEEEVLAEDEHSDFPW